MGSYVCVLTHKSSIWLYSVSTIPYQPRSPPACMVQSYSRWWMYGMDSGISHRMSLPYFSPPLILHLVTIIENACLLVSVQHQRISREECTRSQKDWKEWRSLLMILWRLDLVTQWKMPPQTMMETWKLSYSAVSKGTWSWMTRSWVWGYRKCLSLAT